MAKKYNSKVLQENVLSTEQAIDILKGLGYSIYKMRYWPDMSYLFFYLSEDEEVKASLHNTVLRIMRPKRCNNDREKQKET